MSGQLKYKIGLVEPDKAAIRKAERESDHTLSELYGVRRGQAYRSKDKRDNIGGTPIARAVIGLREKNGVPQALLTGFVTTWVKIDRFAGAPNGYRPIKDPVLDV